MSEDRLFERWRRAPEILEVRDDPSRLDGDTGTLRQGYEVALSSESIERLRTGYLCLRCLEPQSEPFPAKCGAWWCTYAMRTEQAADFARKFKGQKIVGPSTSMEEELDRLDDTHERRIHVPGLQILIPRSIKVEKGKLTATGRLHNATQGRSLDSPENS